MQLRGLSLVLDIQELLPRTQRAARDTCTVMDFVTVSRVVMAKDDVVE